MNRRRRALTLVELVVVLAIVLLLIGIAYASGGPLREKARQTRCLSNLRQIGQALSMYREDWATTESPAEAAAMGFPPSLGSLRLASAGEAGKPYLSGSKSILYCEDIPEENNVSGLTSSYNYNIWAPGDYVGANPPFPTAIAERGTDYPIVTDIWHDTAVSRLDLPQSTRFSLILRLDGRVSAMRTPKEGGGWQW